MGLAIGLSAMLLVMGQASALDSTTVDLTVDPGEKDGSYLIVLETGTVDIKVNSDITVDIYVIRGTQVLDAISGDNFTYEKKWEDKTSLDVEYEVQDLDDMYYIMIHNTHDNDTATVTLEYKLFEQIIQDAAEDAAKDACGSVMILGIAGIIGILILTVIIRSKRC